MNKSLRPFRDVIHNNYTLYYFVYMSTQKCDENALIWDFHRRMFRRCYRAIFPPQSVFPPEKWLYSRIPTPRRMAIQQDSPPERMTTQQSPSENGLNIQLNCSVKFYYHFPVPLLVDYQCRWVYQPSSLYMDDPNDFEWAFPKAKNRASNGTLYDTPPRFAYFQS